MQTHKRTASGTIEPHDFLLPDPSLRRRQPTSPVRKTQIEDAVFEVVTAHARSGRRADETSSRRTSQRQQVLALAGRLAAEFAAATERKLSTLSPQAFMTLLTSLVIAVFWICGGFSALNAAASNGPVAPFALVDTAIDTQDANGMKVALVTGGVRNDSGRIITAPRLAIVSGARGDVIGLIALSVDRIGPGVTIPFSGRFKLVGGKSAGIEIIPERL